LLFLPKCGNLVSMKWLGGWLVSWYTHDSPHFSSFPSQLLPPLELLELSWVVSSSPSSGDGFIGDPPHAHTHSSSLWLNEWMNEWMKRVRFNRVYFTIFRAKVWKILIFLSGFCCWNLFFIFKLQKKKKVWKVKKSVDSSNGFVS
jgi:hypothetical protein